MKLTYKKGKADKLHLHIDDEYFMTVDEAYFLTLNIQNQQELEQKDVDELRLLIGRRRAYNYAVSLLSRRDHASAELIRKLTAKGHGDFAVYAVERLIGQGYIDDERFARSFAAELIRLKGYGRRRVEQELYRKGISREIISTVIEECEFSTEALTELIERKYLRYLEDQKGVNKTVNALLRLGYSYSDIRSAIKDILQREENDIFYE